MRDVYFNVIAYLKAGKIVENEYKRSVLTDYVKLLFENSAYYDEQRIEEINNTINSNREEPIDLEEVCNDVCMLVNKTENWTAIKNLADKLMIEKELEGDVLDQYLLEFCQTITLLDDCPSTFTSSCPVYCKPT